MPVIGHKQSLQFILVFVGSSIISHLMLIASALSMCSVIVERNDFGNAI